jgi:hypothetical protein
LARVRSGNQPCCLAPGFIEFTLDRVDGDGVIGPQAQVTFGDASPARSVSLPLRHRPSFSSHCLELGGRPQAVDLAQRRVVVKRRGLVVEHHVVAHGDAHEVVHPGRGEEHLEVLHVVLIALGVVGVAGVAAHGDAGELAHEVILEARAGDLLAVVEVLGPDEAHHAS